MPSQLPSFHSILIAPAAGILVEKFPFAVKRQRQQDLLVVEPQVPQDNSGGLADLYLYRNPHNPNSGGRPTNGWDKIPVAKLQSPVAVAYADISLNGYNDVIVADEFGSGLHKIDPVGGRVSWLENTGLEADMWIRREIGRFPGIHILKVGHFTHNYSVQILAVSLPDPNPSYQPRLPAAKSSSSVIIYTQPPTITAGRPWLATLAFSGQFRQISDICVVRKNTGSRGVLDKVLIASEQGLALAWYETGSWHSRPVGSSSLRIPHGPTFEPSASLVNMGNGVEGNPQYIVTTESSNGSILAVHTRSTSATEIELHHTIWSRCVLSDFSNDDATISQIQCADLDGDGIDEIIALVHSRNAASSRSRVEGLWYYRAVDLEGGYFEKTKIIGNNFASVVTGDFQFRDKIDLVSVIFDPRYASVNGLELHSNTFSTPHIRVAIIPQNPGSLLLTLPRPESTQNVTEELSLLRLFSTRFSLVVLAPNQFFGFVQTPGLEVKRNGVKVIYGDVEWTKPSGNSHRMGPTLLKVPRHCTDYIRSSIVDSEGVTAGPIGAVFIRMVDEGNDSADDDLKVNNLIPSPYSNDVRDLTFVWEEALTAEGSATMQVSTLDAFRVRFVNEQTDLAHVHFTACRNSPSRRYGALPTLIPGPSPLPGWGSTGPPPLPSTCQIRVCIVNGSETGGIHASGRQILGTLLELPSIEFIVPALTEIAPMWRTRKDGTPLLVKGVVQYPRIYGWISDATKISSGKAKSQERKVSETSKTPRFDVWMDIDFVPLDFKKGKKVLGKQQPPIFVLISGFTLAFVVCIYAYYRNV